MQGGVPESRHANSWSLQITRTGGGGRGACFKLMEGRERGKEGRRRGGRTTVIFVRAIRTVIYSITDQVDVDALAIGTVEHSKLTRVHNLTCTHMPASKPGIKTRHQNPASKPSIKTQHQNPVAAIVSGYQGNGLITVGIRRPIEW